MWLIYLSTTHLQKALLQLRDFATKLVMSLASLRIRESERPIGILEATLKALK